MPGPVANFDPGGEYTGVLDRGTQKRMEVKKFIDAVSGTEKIHANDIYTSKIKNDVREIQYLHAQQGQLLFDKVREGAATKGMRLNEKKLP